MKFSLALLTFALLVRASSAVMPLYETSINQRAALLHDEGNGCLVLTLPVARTTCTVRSGQTVRQLTLKPGETITLDAQLR